ncbi:MAG: hypothetical protein ACXW2Y_02990, partial [Acidimicrobiia bacterium]
MHWAKLNDAMTRTDGPLITPPGDTLLDVLQGFVHELRAAGLPVSMTENLDAMRALEHVSLEDRQSFKSALAATLVKHHQHARAFDTVFDVYFSLIVPGLGGGGDDADGAEDVEGLESQVQGTGGSGGEGQVSAEELAEMLLSALMSMDREQLRKIAAAAVARFAGMEPGRPVGGTYYLYRTLRQLDLDDLSARLMGQAQERGEIPDDPLGERLAREEFESRLRDLRRLVE